MGKLIFVDKDNVKLYTGGNPKNNQSRIRLKTYSKAVSGTDNRKYYPILVKI